MPSRFELENKGFADHEVKIAKNTEEIYRLFYRGFGWLDNRFSQIFYRAIYYIFRR